MTGPTPPVLADPHSAGEEPHKAPAFVPRLRLLDAIALGVSNIIGVGIFTTPAIIAALVPAATGILMVWVAGGLIALAGAFTYAQLARVCPRAGGEYAYLARAFGPLFGFLSGWTSLIAGFSGAVAASAVALVSYAGHYWPGMASTHPFAVLPALFADVPLSPRSLTAAAVIVLFAILHVCGLGPGKLAQSAFALLVLGTIAILLLCGFTLGQGSWRNFEGTFSFGGSHWLLALIPVMFTYSGWNAAAYVAEEIQDSKRTLGLALTLATGIAIAVYLALNTLYLFAMPVSEMRSALAIGDVAAQRLFDVHSGFITPLLIVALSGAISAMTIAGPRVYYAMARDGAFLPWLNRIHPRHRTPARAIVLQAAWSILLVVLGGFEQILLYTGFAIVLSSGGAALAWLTLRRRMQLHGEIFRTVVVPVAFAGSTLAVAVHAVFEAPETSLVGLLVIAGGIPLFLLSRWRNAARTQVNCPPQPAGANGIDPTSC